MARSPPPCRGRSNRRAESAIAIVRNPFKPDLSRAPIPGRGRSAHAPRGSCRSLRTRSGPGATRHQQFARPFVVGPCRRRSSGRGTCALPLVGALNWVERRSASSPRPNRPGGSESSTGGSTLSGRGTGRSDGCSSASDRPTLSRYSSRLRPRARLGVARSAHAVVPSQAVGSDDSPLGATAIATLASRNPGLIESNSNDRYWVLTFEAYRTCAS